MAVHDGPQVLHLPQELCDMIALHLTNLKDVLRLRLVCRATATGFTQSVLDLANQKLRVQDRAFKDREFIFLLDDIGIQDIEALANSFLASQVRRVKFADRVLRYHWATTGPQPHGNKQRDEERREPSRYKTGHEVWLKEVDTFWGECFASQPFCNRTPAFTSSDNV